MGSEAPMAIRKRLKHSGDIGEVDTLKEFLLMGAVVNSLTGSDYGLDLHIQVPLRPQEYNKLGNSWSLSGRVAHAQVKNMTSGQDPSPAVERVRGWIAGAEVGVPTFLIILKGDRKRFASPRDLKATLAAWEEAHAENLSKDARRTETDETEPKTPKTVTLPEKNTHAFRPQTFPWLLHLWTSYPGVMMKSDVQDWLCLDSQDLLARGHQFIAEVLLAWMKSHHSDTTPVLSKTEIAVRAENDGLCVFEGSDAIAGALAIVQAGFRTMYQEEPESSRKAELFGWDAINHLGMAWRRHQRYPHSNLMTSYSTSPHTGRSLNEAIQLLEDVMEFHRYCASGWQATEDGPPPAPDANAAVQAGQ